MELIHGDDAVGVLQVQQEHDGISAEAVGANAGIVIW